MEFAVLTEPQTGGTYEELSKLAVWAEKEGFDVFSRSDHYMDGERSAHATDALTTLAGIGRDTSRIKLNVLVFPAAFRHPATLAKTAATIDELSGGRFELGVGTGWMKSEHERFTGTTFPNGENASSDSLKHSHFRAQHSGAAKVVFQVTTIRWPTWPYYRDPPATFRSLLVAADHGERRLSPDATATSSICFFVRSTTSWRDETLCEPPPLHQAGTPM